MKLANELERYGDDPPVAAHQKTPKGDSSLAESTTIIFEPTQRKTIAILPDTTEAASFVPAAFAIPHVPNLVGGW